MASSNDELFVPVVEALARATAAAAGNGYAGVAYATIEVQYVIASRIRPWFATEYLKGSNFAVLDYTVRALEAEVAAFAPIAKRYTCPDELSGCMAQARSVADRTACLMRYAACIARTFAAFAEKRGAPA